MNLLAAKIEYISSVYKNRRRESFTKKWISKIFAFFLWINVRIWIMIELNAFSLSSWDHTPVIMFIYCPRRQSFLIYKKNIKFFFISLNINLMIYFENEYPKILIKDTKKVREKACTKKSNLLIIRIQDKTQNSPPLHTNFESLIHFY